MFTINVGLERATKGAPAWQPAIAVLALRRNGITPRAWTVHQSDTEATLVARCELAPFHNDAAAQVTCLCDDLDQDCIAVLGEDGRGELVGPRPWGEFNPAFFLTLEGRRLGEPLAC